MEEEIRFKSIKYGLKKSVQEHLSIQRSTNVHASNDFNETQGSETPDLLASKDNQNGETLWERIGMTKKEFMHRLAGSHENVL